MSERPEPRIEPREKEPTTINKIHFLVHPGWLSKSGNVSKDRLNLAKDPAMQTLFEGYINKAKKLAPNTDELMVTFAPADSVEFLNDFSADKNAVPPYAEVILAIKEILGDRLIVLADNSEYSQNGAVVSKNRDKFWKRIKDIAAKRGFKFSDELSGRAYGELMDQCVRRIAENMHQASGMSETKPILVEVSLTDYPRRYGVAADDIATMRNQQPTAQYLSEHVKLDFGDE